jgi:hypothetical protein
MGLCLEVLTVSPHYSLTYMQIQIKIGKKQLTALILFDK